MDARILSYANTRRTAARRPSDGKPRLSTIFATAIMGAALIFQAAPAPAASQYFTDLGGPLTWNATNANWSNASGGLYNVVWTQYSDAIFEGTAGTVNVSGTMQANVLQFDVTGYLLTGGTIQVGNPTTPGFYVISGGTATIGTNLTQSGAGNTIHIGKAGYAGILNLNGGNNAVTRAIALDFGQVNMNNANAIGTGALTIAAGTVIDNASGAPITMASNNAQTWSGDFTFLGSNNLSLGTGAVTLGANRLVTIAGSNLTVGGVIGGAGFGITKQGSGTLTLGGNNTYTGNLTLSAGQLNLNNNGAAGTAAGTFAINGGTLDNTGGADVTLASKAQTWGADITYLGYTRNLNLGAGAVTMTASRKVTVNNNTLTVGGIIGPASAYSLTKLGGGALTLSSANIHTGGMTLTGGRLNIGNASALGTAAGTLTINGGEINNSSAAAITTVNYPQIWNGDFTFIGSQSLNLGTGGVTMNGSRQVTVNANTLTVGGIIGGPGSSVTKLGAGALTLGGANSYTGGTNINAGTLHVSSDGNLGGTGVPNPITINGGTLQVNTAAVTLAPNHPLVIGANGGTIYGNGFGLAALAAGKLTGSGTLTINGSANTVSTLESIGAQAGFTGPINIIGGRIRMSNAAATLGSGRITAGTGTSSLWIEVAGVSLANPMSIQGNGGEGRGVVRFQNGATLNGAITLINNAGFSVENSGQTATLNGSISGPYILTLGGLTGSNAGGIYAVNGNNSMSGVTLNGILNMGHVNALGTNASLVTVNGGTLNLGAFSPTIGQLGGTGGTVALGGQTLTVNQSTNATTFSGVISGANGKLIKGGTATLALAGANTYTGATTINDGTLALTNALALNGGGNITFGGGTLQFSTANTNDYAVKIKSSTAAPVSLDTNGQNVTFSGAIDNSNTGGLTKLGAGELMLAGANAYTGATTVAGGTLEIMPAGAMAASSAFTVKDGAALQLDSIGRTYASLTAEDGSTLLLPAVSGQTTTLTGALNFSGSPCNVTVMPSFSGPAELVGTTYDLLTAAGGITGTPAIIPVFDPSARVSGTIAVVPGTPGYLRLTITSAASNLTWDNGAANDRWSLDTADTNFSGNYFANADAVTFDDTVAGGSINLIGNLLPSLVTVNSASNYSFGGTGSIGGAGSIIKQGAGTLILNPAYATPNTYIGGTTVTAGALQLSQMGAAGPGPIMLNGGRLILAGGANPGLAEGYVINATAFNLTMLNPVSALRLGTPSAHTNTTAVWPAVREWLYTGFFNVPGPSDATWTFGGNIDDNEYLAVDHRVLFNDGTWNSTDIGSINLTPGWHRLDYRGWNNGAGGGTNNNADGWTTFFGFGYDSQGRNQKAAGNFLPFTDPGDGSFLGQDLIISNLIYLPAGSNEINVLKGATISGVISGPGRMSQTGAGASLILYAANTYSGGTTINDGAALVINSDGNLGAVPGLATAGHIVLNNGTLKFTAAGTFTLNANRGILLSGDGGTLDSAFLGTGDTNVIGSIIAGTSLTLRSNGGVAAGGGGGGLGIQLAGANTFVGDVTILSGLVSYNATGSGFGDPANKIVLNGGGLLDNLMNYTLNRNIEVQSGGGYFRLYTNAVAKYTGAITGSGNINRIDAGFLSLTGDLSGYTGIYDSQNALCVTNLMGPGVIGGAYKLSNATAGLGFACDLDQSLAGVISGVGYTSKSLTGALTLSGANTYSGVTNLYSGKLNINHPSAIGTGALTFVYPGVTIDNTSGADITLATNNAQTWNDFIFAGTRNLNLGSGAVTLGATRTTTITAGTLTVGGVISGAGFGITKEGDGTLALAGANSYTGATTINSGTLELTQSGSVAATAITVNYGGGLQIDATGKTLASTLNANDGSTLTLPAAFGLTTNLTGALTFGAGTVTVKPVFIGAPVAGTYDLLTVTGAITGAVPTLVLDPASRFTGSLAIVAGAPSILQLTVDAPAALNLTWNNGAVTGNWNFADANFTGLDTLFKNYDAVTFDDTVAGGAVVLQGVLIPGAVTVNNTSPNDYTFSGTAITGSGSLTKSGTAALNLNAPNTYTGGTILSDGALNLGDPAALGSGALTISGGTIDNTSAADFGLAGNNAQNWNGDFTYLGSARNLNLGAGAVALSGNQQVTVGANTLTVGGIISGGFSLTKAGAGALTLLNANIYTGGTILSGGQLNINNASALGTAAGTFTINGGTIDNTSPGAITTLNYPLVLGGDFAFNGTQSLNLGTGLTSLGGSIRQVTVNGGILTLGGVISGAGGITKSGLGALTLTGANTYGGNTTLNAGRLTLGTVTSLGAATGTFVINGGSLDASAALAMTNANPQTWNGDFTFVGTNNLTHAAGPVALTADSNITVSANTLAVPGIISGSGGITKSGTGALTLSGTNAHTGGTTLTAGTLNLGSASALGATGSTFTISGLSTFNNVTGGVLTFTNTYPQFWNADFNFTGTNSIVLGPGPVTVNGQRSVGCVTNGFTVGGPISEGVPGSGLIKLGGGTMTLNGATSYTGPTTITAGLLALGNAGALGGGGIITFNGGTLQHSASNTADLGNYIRFSSFPILIDTNSQSVTYAGIIDGSNASGLTKAGAGTLTLTGVNTYGGLTTINAGGTLATGGLGQLGPSAYTAGITDNGTFLYGSSNDQTIYGRIIGTGALALNAGAGALTLNGVNTYTGATTVNGGTLTLNNTNGPLGAVTVAGLAAGGNLNINGTTSFGGNTMTVGAAATDRSVAVIAADTTMGKLVIGNAANASGAVIQDSGTANIGIATSGADVLSPGRTGYGYYRMNGGTINTGQLAIGGNGASSYGVVDMNAGAINVTATGGWLLWGWGATSKGVLNLFGGTITNPPSGNNVVMGFAASTSFGMLNLLGPTALLDTTNNGRVFDMMAADGNNSVINLNNGTLEVNYILRSKNTGTARLNFNGGTLKANINTAGFLSTTNLLTGCYVYPGGAVIDNAGKIITIAQPLLAPTGDGVSGIDLADNGAGYIGAPVVEISGGGGAGATAIAQVDLDSASPTSGQLTGIILTSAGNGYTGAPTVTLTGGGYTTPALPGAVTFSPNASGGLTANGAGKLILTGASTFTGGTAINGGTVALGVANALVNNASAPITVNNGGTLAFNLQNTWGAHTATILTPIIINAGGTVTNGAAVFNALGPVTLNGGVLAAIAGNTATWPSWGLKGTVTVAGGVLSTLSGSGLYSGYQLGDGAVTGTTFDVAADSSLLVSGLLQDGRDASSNLQASSLTKTSSGTLMLSGLNTYTGATTINGGTLELTATGALSGASAVTVNNGGALQVDSTGKTLASVTVNDGATLVLPAVTGQTTILAGALTFAGGTVTIRPVFNAAATGSYNLLTAAGVAGALPTFNVVFDPSTRVAGSVAVVGNNLVLTITQATTNLVWNNGSANNRWSTDTLDLNFTGAYFQNGDAVTFGDVAAGAVSLMNELLPSAVTVNNSSGADYTFSGAGSIGGLGSLTKSGAGVLNLDAVTNYSGVTAINNGTLALASSGALGGPGLITFGGGTLQFSPANTGDYSTRFENSVTGAITLDTNGQTVALNGAIDNTNTGGLVKLGAGALILNPPITAPSGYTGGTTISAGALQISQNGAAGAGAIALDGGRLILAAGAGLDEGSLARPNLFARNPSTAIRLGTPLANVKFGTSGGVNDVWGANITYPYTGYIRVPGSSPVYWTFGSNIDDDSYLEIDGMPLFNTTGNNSVFGSIFLTPGWHQLDYRCGNGTGGAGGNWANQKGFGLDMLGRNANVDANFTILSDPGDGSFLAQDLYVPNNILLAAGPNEINVTTGATIGGVISGPGALTQTGDGSILVLTGANTFAGQLSIPNSTLSIPTINDDSADGPLGNSANSVVLGGAAGQTGTLIYSGSPAVSSKKFTLATGGFGVFQTTNYPLTLNGVIDGGGGLIKNFINTVALGGANTYSGPTTVNSGTLELTDAGAAPNTAITVNGGGTLQVDATGKTLASLTVLNGASLVLPAVSAQTTLLSGALTFAGSPTVTIKPVFTAGMAAGDYDLITATGGITGSPTFVLSLDPSSRITASVAVVGNVLRLTIVGTPLNLVWDNGAGTGNWSLNPADVNFTGNYFANYDSVTFGDTAAGPVSLPSILTPSAVTVNSASDYFFSGAGAISGPTSLVKSGTGALTLLMPNTYTGGTILSGGRLNINNATAIGLAASALTINGGTTLDNASAAAITLANNNPQIWNGDFTFLGTQSMNLGFSPVSLTGNRQVTVTANTLTIAGVISGDGFGFAKLGGGALSLSGANSYSGVTSIGGGTLSLGGPLVLAGGGNIAFTGGTMQYTAANTIDYSTRIKNSTGAIILDTNSQNVILAGVIDSSNTGGMTKNGNGTLTLAGANAYTGVTTMNTGQLNLNNPGALGDSVFTIAGGTIDNTSGADLALSTNNAQNWNNTVTYAGSTRNLDLGTGPVTLSANRTVSITSGILTVGGPISGAYSLTKDGGTLANLSTLVLGGNSSFTGGVTVTIGKILITNSGALGAGTKTITLTNGTAGNPQLHLDGSAGDIVVPSTISYQTSNQTDGAFVNDAGNNTIAGGITLTSGGGATFLVSNAGKITFTGGISPNTTSRELRLKGNGDGEVSGIISNGSTVNMPVYKDSNALGGAGTWTLSGANTFSGALTVLAGTLAIPTINNASANGPLGNNATAVNLGAAGATVTLQYTGATASSTKPFALAGTGVGASVFQVDDPATNLTLSGALSGANANLAKTGAGTLTLSAANTYTGNTIISNGTLKVNNASAIASGAGEGNVIMDGGAAAGILDINGLDITINGLSGVAGAALGQVVNNAVATANILTVGNNDASSEFAGVLADNSGVGGTLALAKTGLGTLTLSGASTYTGATTVSNGTLTLTGSLANTAVTVDPGATLSGTGVIGGAVAVNGNLTPGGAGTTGTLTINNTLTLTGNTLIDVNKIGAALTYDQVAGLTGATFGGALTLTMTGDALAPGDTLQIFTGNFGGFAGAFASISPAAPGANLRWNTSQLLTAGTISVESVPPPMTAMLDPLTDTGLYNNDNLTTLSDVTIIGLAEVDATVGVYEGAMLLGSGPATGGAYSIPVTLAEGFHHLELNATDTLGNVSLTSTPLDVVVDQTSPTVAAVTVVSGANDLAEIMVSFSEAMGASSQTALNYAVSGAGVGTLAPNPTAVSIVNSSTVLLTWANAGEMLTGGDITLTVSGMDDLAGNAIDYPTTGTHVAGGQGAAPQVAGVTVQSGSNNLSTIDVSFSEAVAVSSMTLSSYSISGPGAGTMALNPTGVSALTSSSVQLTWTSAGEMLNGSTVTITVINVQDFAGNTVDPANDSADGTGIGVAPSVVSITPAGGNPTSVSTIVFDVTFDEPTTGLGAGNFTPVFGAGVSGGAVTGIAGGGANWQVTVTGVVSADQTGGELSLALTSVAGITDLAGNALSGPFSAGTSVTVDLVAPSVVSITPEGVSPTSASAIVFDVVFNESVLGLDTVNFTPIYGVGVSGGAATVVSGGGTNWQVTVTGIVSAAATGGDISLALTSVAGITDPAGNTLSGAFGAGTSVTVDLVVPTATIGSPSVAVTSAGPVTYNITFNESVTALTPAGIRLNATGSVIVTSVTVTGSGADYTVTLSDLFGNGFLGITVLADSVFDAAGNGNAVSTDSVTAIVFNTNPSVSLSAPSVAITSGGPVLYTATFTDSVYGFTSTGVELITTGTVAVGGVDVAMTSQTEYVITLSAITGDGELSIRILGGAATDIFGNGSLPGAPGAPVAVDNTAPTLQSVTVMDILTIRVQFSEAMPNGAGLTSAGNYTFAGAAPIAASAVTVVSATQVDVTVNEMTDGSTYTVFVNTTAAGPTDPAGNHLDAPSNSAVFIGLGELPRVISAAPRDIYTVRVGFSEDMTNDATLTRAANYTFTGVAALTATGVTVIDARTVDVTVNEMTNGAAYIVSVNTGLLGPTDAAALNPVDPANNSQPFTGLGQLPSVAINQVAGQIDPTSRTMAFDIVFSEGIYGLTFSDVLFTGTATGTSGSLTTITSSTYRLDIAFSATDGTVIPVIPAGAAFDVTANNPNTTSTATDNSVLYDVTPPLSVVELPADGSTVIEEPFLVQWSYSDVGSGIPASGVKSVDLYLNYNNGAPRLMGQFAAATTGTMVFSSALGDNGLYGFYTIATDNAGNTEVFTGYDVHATVMIRAASAVRDWAKY